MRCLLCTLGCGEIVKRNTIFLAVFFICELAMVSQINVQFSAESQEGCAPFLVSFINETEGDDSYTYVWNFGNGNTSTLKNPQATYPTASSYTVSLTVSNATETQTLTKEDFITVHESPVVDFLPKDLINDCAPLDISFTSTILPESGNDSYLWDFGDGKLSNEKNPIHTYAEAGVFNVTLVVEDEFGCVGKVSYENIIKAQKPTAVFDANIKESCNGQLQVNFSNHSYGLGELVYAWDFGDGQKDNSKHVSHLYDAEGEYDVSLKVTDDLGCKDSLVIENYIEVTNTIADFSIQKDTVCIGEYINFTNASTNNNSNNWDFGDGNTSSDTNPKHRFLEGGDYTVKLTIENYECSDFVTASIHVEEVDVEFSASADYSCQVPVDISYTSQSEKAISYDWRFGNGSVSTKKDPINTYVLTEILKNTSKESYTDTLTVTSKYGCKATLIKNDFVNIVLPKVNILTDNSTSGCKPIDVDFSSQVVYDTSNDEILNYQWKLDEVEVSEENNWQNNFTEAGKYKVGLEISTQLGCLASDIKTVSIGEQQNPDFNVLDKTVFCASEAVMFEDLSEDNTKIDFTLWEFGDGETSDFGVPMHLYVDTGYMDVTLKVYHNGCLSQITKEKALYINGPIANINRIIDCENSNTANFQIELIDANTYSCDFADGHTIADEGNSFSHTYDNKGLYGVILTAVNSSNGCTYERINNINVYDSKALFDTISLGPCVGNTISFDASASEDVYKFLHNDERNYYLWNFGDSETEYFTDDVISYSYKSSGDYNVRLIVKDVNDCADTLIQTLKVYKPDVNFNTNYKQGCMPVMFEFTDLSVSENPIDNWLWSFGDGETATNQNTTHEYQEFGNYTVSLKVTDDIGCSSTRKLANEISVVFPDVDFKVSDSSSCLNDTLEFSDESESIIESFLWDFGDGVTSDIRNPEHAYSSPGDYTISLNVIDNHGCEAELIESDFINIQEPPVAQFVSNLQESNCYPFPVDFEDQSTSPYLGSWKWIFGDNLTGSVLQNPKHIYTRPDDYDVTLIAYTTNGCSDTITKEKYIYVGGPYAEINLVDTACIYNDISFSLNNKKNLSTILWDFGDGVTSDVEIVSHKYNRKGVSYPSILLNTNSNFACTKVIQDSLYIDEITAGIKFLDDLDKGCVPFEAGFINDSYKASTYQWSSSDGFNSKAENPNHTYVLDGDYDLSLVAKSDFGCEDTAMTAVTVFPLPEISTSADTFICKDDNIEIWAEGGVSYSWVPADGLDNNWIPNPIASPGQTTEYAVEVTDVNNCVDTEKIRLTVQQYPYIDFSDSTIIIGESINIDLGKSDIRNFYWTPNTGISCVDCSNPVFKPLETIQYTVSLTDTSDCFTMDYPVDIVVQKKYSVDVPTAFTPNNDNLNDYVIVKGWGIQELVYFRIFNRSGELVFESKELTQGWDGTYKGKPQNADVYNFVVRVKTYGDEYLDKKGNIKLIR